MGNGVTSIKAILFDARDTLGEVDSPAHFIRYRPSTAQRLDAVKNQIKVRIGIILIQATWANTVGFLQPRTGVDPIIVSAIAVRSSMDHEQDLAKHAVEGL
ncbi:MAG: hypothetical protein JO114_14160 [Planctomycetaceae bacterium]|nr:hypothetical protein [Planctomycetaceae bacterium]